jgi:hypothetical protein
MEVLMTARDELREYILDNYGSCDRDTPKRNDCFWGKDENGKDNGCNQVGWKGRACKHWHPVDEIQLEAILSYHVNSGDTPADNTDQDH